jgi:hypothetical protein
LPVRHGFLSLLDERLLLGQLFNVFLPVESLKSKTVCPMSQALLRPHINHSVVLLFKNSQGGSVD